MSSVRLPAAPESEEAQIATVRLWTLPLLFCGSLLAWALLQRHGLLPELPYGSIWIPVLVWWLLEAAPRPFSLRALLGPLPRRADYGWIALLLLGCFCVRLAFWSAQSGWEALRTGHLPPAVAFSFPRSSPLASFIAILVAPVLEELVFRRTLFRKWRLRMGPRTALLLSSVLFGIPHSEPLPSALLGVVFVLLYTSTRSLWAPVLLHIVNNATSVPLGYASPLQIGLDTWWKLASYVLVLLLGSAAVLWFLLRSWRTLGDPLPGASAQSPPFESRPPNFAFASSQPGARPQRVDLGQR